MDLEALPLPGLVLTALLASGVLYLLSFTSRPRTTSFTTTTTTTTTSLAVTISEEAYRVAALYIYPIKSCRGISLATSSVVSTGLRWDRQFTFATRALGGEGEWRFITQRQYPLLSRVVTSLDTGKGVLGVSWPWRWFGRIGFAVPLEGEGEETLPVRVWNDVVTARWVGVDPVKLEALKTFLGVAAELELRLCRVQQLREVYRCAPRREELGWQVVTGFADAYPLHLLSLSSVTHLGSRPTVAAALGKDLSPQRFRANIIITGAPAFDEDGWKRFDIGGFPYTAACRTVRCKLPNVDPETGIKHPVEPDRTMRKYRNIDAGAKNNACMGMQVVCDRMEGAMVSVGDAIRVRERGEHFYINQ